MYDMYPEWGPAHHRSHTADSPGRQALQTALDRRDNGGERPDDPHPALAPLGATTTDGVAVPIAC